MKGLLLSVCLILAMPILFSPSGRPLGPVPFQALACDVQNAGNVCDEMKRHGNHGAGEKNGAVTGFSHLAESLLTAVTVFSTWLALR
ncbi:MAG TPA: hypothetical protein VI756_13725 [Blastocatellia bacterium]